MTNAKSIFLNVHEVSIKISSNDASFLEYVQKYFSIFLVTETHTQDIVCSFNFEAGYSLSVPRIFGNGKLLLGEYVSYDTKKSEFSFINREYLVQLLLEDKPIIAETTFRKNLFRHIANKLFFKKGKTNTHYYRVATRLVIQNLLFVMLKQNAGIGVLSAAAVAIDGKAYVFAGLPGSGKSTIINKIIKHYPDAEVLAENYVLFKDNTIYSFPEVGWSPKRLTTEIKNIFVVGRGEELSVTTLATESALIALSGVNDATAELPVHSQFAAYSIINNKFIIDHYMNELRRLTDTVSSELLITDKGLSQFMSHFIETHEK